MLLWRWQLPKIFVEGQKILQFGKVCTNAFLSAEKFLAEKFNRPLEHLPERGTFFRRGRKHFTTPKKYANLTALSEYGMLNKMDFFEQIGTADANAPSLEDVDALASRRTATSGWANPEEEFLSPQKRRALEKQRAQFEKQLPKLLREMADCPELVVAAPPPPELIRNYLVNRLLVESQDADTKYRLRALELLGKLQYVGAFNANIGLTSEGQATAKDMEAQLREKLSGLMKLEVPAIDGNVVEAAVAGFSDEPVGEEGDG